MQFTVPRQLHHPVQAEAPQQIGVVTHDHQRPRIGGEAIHQGIDALEVQVVGGFVQHQQLHRGIGEQHPGQRHPEPFAPGQGADETFRHFSAQQEPGQPGADLVGWGRRAAPFDAFDHREISVQLEALVQETDPAGGRVPHHSAEQG